MLLKGYQVKLTIFGITPYWFIAVQFLYLNNGSYIDSNVNDELIIRIPAFTDVSLPFSAQTPNCDLKLLFYNKRL